MNEKDGHNYCKTARERRELRQLARSICRIGVIEFNGTAPRIRVGLKGNLLDMLSARFGVEVKKPEGYKFKQRCIVTVQERPSLRRLIKAILPYSMRMQTRARELVLVLEVIDILEAKPKGWKEAVEVIKGRIKYARNRRSQEH